MWSQRRAATKGQRLRKRPGSHAFRRECRVTEALDLKAMHKAELKVGEQRHDRDYHRTRASTTLVSRREAADCRGDGGGWCARDRGGCAARRLSWAAVHLAAAGSGWRAGSTAGRDIYAGADVGDGDGG